MEQMEPEQIDGELQSETPEDVAVLYSWANLQGAKYRDFSASRREYRAQMRHRAAETQRESERHAQLQAELTVAAAEKAARVAEEAARFHESAALRAAESPQLGELAEEEVARAREMRMAAELARRTSLERLEAARRAEAVAAAEAAARREEREMAEAHASAERQSQQYRESEIRRRVAAGPQPTVTTGEIPDPYVTDLVSNGSERAYRQPVVPEDDMAPSRHRVSSREHRLIVPQPDPLRLEDMRREYLATEPMERAAESAAANAGSRPGQVRPHEPKFEEDMPALIEPPSRVAAQAALHKSQAEHEARELYAARVAAAPFATRVSSGALRLPQELRTAQSIEVRQNTEPAPRISNVELETEPTPEHAVPAWISSQSPDPVSKRTQSPMLPGEDTLQRSREQVASRWYALKGVFDHPQDGSMELRPQRAKDLRAPLLTVFSLAGGVGKTSLIATLGRALSSTGERVLLTDTTSHGLLPFYFGATELRPGAVRTFSPPAGRPDAPIYMVSYDVSQKTGDAASQKWLLEEMTRNSRGMQRVLVDLMPGAAWVARDLASMNSTILVPLTPDMNSVISLKELAKFFAGMLDEDGRRVQPVYVLNQFDASLPLHLDVREVMRQQLGDRLLPFTIRRSPGMSEALAEGMTVMDYAPDSPIAADIMGLVSWVRAQSAPAASDFTSVRWSER